MEKSRWHHLNRLSIATIVVAGGRVGSDFIQSLFDGHPEVVTFDGPLFFNEFYENAVSIWGTSLQFQVRNRLTNICREDFFNEFAWKHLHAFKSKYDNFENKDKLGSHRNQSNEVKIDEFVNHAVSLMAGCEWSRRNAFLATYGAFALARGEDLLQKKILLHHIHHLEKLPPFLEDFPNIKVIAAVRDPRAGYFSTIEHWYRYSKEQITPANHAYVIRRILEEANPLFQINGIDVRVNLLERLHQDPELVLRKMCQWLGIEFHSAVLKSTWGGKEWWGDALSDKIKKPFASEMYDRSVQEWKKKMSFQDRVLLEVLMRKKIEWYGYVREFRSLFWNWFGVVLILFPNRFESRLFKQCLGSFNVVSLLRWFHSLFQRYRWMFRKWLQVLLQGDTSFEYF